MAPFLHALTQRMRRLPQSRPPRLAAAALALSLALSVALSAHAYAQVLYGSLTGTVTDASAATVPGATVQALNIETGTTKETITDDRGAFSFNDLQPGTYKVTVTLEGFASISQENVGIQANRVFRLDLKLQPKTVAARLAALRFFYVAVLKRPVTMGQLTRKLEELLSPK